VIEARSKGSQSKYEGHHFTCIFQHRLHKDNALNKDNQSWWRRPVIFIENRPVHVVYSTVCKLKDALIPGHGFAGSFEAKCVESSESSQVRQVKSNRVMVMS
jgi:hypothetical protein